MGCGFFNPTRDAFTAVPVLSVSDAPNRDTDCVHIVGQVAHIGMVMVSPFGQLEGVAMKVAAEQKMVSGNKRTFSAERALDFKLVGGGQEILVEKGAWTLCLSPSHYEMNIVRDDKRTDGSAPSGGVKSGGAAWNQRDMPPLTVKPHAAAWWDKFNDGRDPLNGSGIKGQRPRGARESILKDGQACAVLGALKVTDSGARKLVCMGVGKGASVITNQSSLSPAINNCKDGKGRNDA
eukprot:CAMPEP_0117466710 /NCGR_PEP_ID=MMETSP0784-20121206/5283_1 /TAXON_ID=39447 /ORGANISM="" /LENGTH=235 /DNA_ID=CAMNT_0005260661 /DNA_START=73 /DNA_END=776 /DNA_ORIENTATION=+